MKRYLAALSLAGTGLLAGCATWSTTEVKTAAPVDQKPAPAKAKTPASKILVTESDLFGRKYKVLGDISVTVNKTTIFHQSPTRQMVANALRKRAAELGADAVILVRYGTVGITPMSWGSLGGKGRAVSFVN